MPILCFQRACPRADRRRVTSSTTTTSSSPPLLVTLNPLNSTSKTIPQSSRTPSRLCRPHVYISIRFGGPVSHYRIGVASGRPGKGCMCFLTESHMINVQRNFNLKRSFSSSQSCCWSPRVLVLQPVNNSGISATVFD